MGSSYEPFPGGGGLEVRGGGKQMHDSQTPQKWDARSEKSMRAKERKP